MILEERRRGRTIFFSTHILSDVPQLCDNVAILQKGETVIAGRLDELLTGRVLRTDVVIAGESGELRAAWEQRGLVARPEKGQLVIEVPSEQRVEEVLKDALARGLEVVEVAPRYQSLEELFVSKAQ